MRAPSFAASDYAAAFQNLLPRGRAWPRDTDTVMSSVSKALALTYERSNASANQLLVETFPSTTFELLGEWESTLGLPSKYAYSAGTDEDRQAQVVSALTDVGGQSAAYFIGLAGKLGLAITITQFRPYRVSDPVNSPIYGLSYAHSWQVNAPGSVVYSYVTDDVDSAIASWSNAALLAVINAYRPAHTVVAFNYS